VFAAARDHHHLESVITIVWNHRSPSLEYAERLQVRRRGGRKRALGTRAPMALPQGPNQRWSLDFLSDAMTHGRRFRILAIVETLRANAWHWPLIRPCRPCGSRASLTP